jgi:hypothetical protein
VAAAPLGPHAGWACCTFGSVGDWNATQTSERFAVVFGLAPARKPCGMCPLDVRCSTLQADQIVQRISFLDKTTTELSLFVDFLRAGDFLATSRHSSIERESDIEDMLSDSGMPRPSTPSNQGTKSLARTLSNTSKRGRKYVLLCNVCSCFL